MKKKQECPTEPVESGDSAGKAKIEDCNNVEDV